MDYRKKVDYKVIRFPQGIENEDRGLNECCCSFTAVADLTSLDTWKNDKKGVFVKKSDASDSVTFTITKCGETGALTAYGQTATFPNEPLGVGYIYDWREYLTNYGPGQYTISVDFTISGVTSGYDIGVFTLIPYSAERLDNSCRIRSELRSYNMQQDFDFTGSNFVDDLRFDGIFGLMQPNTEVNNLVNKGYKVVKTTREHLKSYELIAEPLTYCQSTLLLDLHLLNEDECFMTDHNSCNHSYQYNDIPVVLNGNVSCDYPQNARLMRLTAQFGDRIKNVKSMYNV